MAAARADLPRAAQPVPPSAHLKVSLVGHGFHEVSSLQVGALEVGIAAVRRREVGSSQVLQEWRGSGTKLALCCATIRAVTLVDGAVEYAEKVVTHLAVEVSASEVRFPKLLGAANAKLAWAELTSAVSSLGFALERNQEQSHQTSLST
jgi:hypothetical protein